MICDPHKISEALRILGVDRQAIAHGQPDRITVNFVKWGKASTNFLQRRNSVLAIANFR
jgi:hypothetical protein